MHEKKSLISFFEESEYHTIKYRNYFPIYEKLFSKFVNKKITFVEIGVFSGGSLFMWRKAGSAYFTNYHVRGKTIQDG